MAVREEGGGGGRNGNYDPFSPRCNVNPKVVQ